MSDPQILDLSAELLDTILSHLPIPDLLTLTKVSPLLRTHAIYRLSLTETLHVAELRRVLKERGMGLTQPGVQMLAGFCRDNLQQLTFQVCTRTVNPKYSAPYKINTSVVTNLPGFLSTSITPLPLLTTLSLRLHNVSCDIPRDTQLPTTLRSLRVSGHVTDGDLGILVGGLPDLTDLYIDNNIVAEGSFIHKLLESNQIKVFSMNRCTQFTSQNLELILKKYNHSLQTVIITGFPSEELLDFNKTTLRPFLSLRTLEISSWCSSVHFTQLAPFFPLSPNLTDLSIQHCVDLGRTPDNLRVVCQGCPLLEKLDLSGSMVASARSLAPLSSLRFLQRLVLHQLVTRPGVAEVGGNPQDQPQNNDNFQAVGGRDVFADDIPILPTPDFDTHFFINSIILGLPSLRTLYLQDLTKSMFLDHHIYQILSNTSITKLSVLGGCEIGGEFIDKCCEEAEEERHGGVEVTITTEKGQRNGDTLFYKTFLTPPWLRVSILWED